MILLIIGLILFIGLVVVHEMGHFFAARRNGVDVEEFGIGFPPKVWSKQMKGGWLFSINLLPLGGFVRLKGEHDSDTDKGTFGAASLKAKTEIMAAGVVMNLITGVLLLTLLALLGMPKVLPNQFTVASDTKVIQSDVLVGNVSAGSPAAKAGLQTGDRLIAYGTERSDDIDAKYCKADPSALQIAECVVPFKSAQEIPKVTLANAGENLLLVYERDGTERIITPELLTKAEVESSRKTDSPKGYLGIVPAEYTMQRSTWSAPIVAVGLTKQITVLTFQGLGKALAGVGKIIAGFFTGNMEARRAGQTQASSQVSGPLGIFFILKDGGILGYQYMLFIIAIISLTLAIMNFLPIPALDGGRLWLTLATRGLGRPISQEKEELINGIGFLLLLGLIGLITFVDIKRFF